MDTSHQEVFLGEHEIEAMENYDPLQFETVLIPDGEFQVVFPQPSSPNRGETIESSDVLNLACKENIESIIRDSYEEYTILPSDFFEKIKKVPSFIETHEVCGSAAKENSLNQNQEWANEEPFRTIKSQVVTNSIFMNEPAKGSPEIASLVASGVLKTMKEETQARIDKKKMKVLKTQEKEKYLEETLEKINEVVCVRNKKTSKTVLGDNIKANERLGTVINLPAFKERDDAQNKAQSSKVSKPLEMGPNFNNTQNKFHSSDKECNIDFLKECIIEASRTLIKTEKSLRVLGKFLHSDVLIEKRAAIKHLNHYQCTVNTFHKTIKAIDKRLLARYSHFIPKTEPLGESQCSKVRVDTQKYKDDVVESGIMSKENDSFKIKPPPVVDKKFEDVDTGDQSNSSSSLVVHQSNIDSGQTKPKKRKGSNDPSNVKRIKTNIVYANRMSC